MRSSSEIGMYLIPFIGTEEISPLSQFARTLGCDHLSISPASDRLARPLAMTRRRASALKSPGEVNRSPRRAIVSAYMLKLEPPAPPAPGA
jgi:hypothetical protein